MNSVWAVRRDDVFSPNSVEADRNILLSVLERLGADSSRLVDERDLTAAHTAEIYLSMARRPQTLAILREKERQGAVVVNATAGVLACSRSELERLMRREHLPTAPIEGPNGYWVKRGDAAAQSKDDVVFCADKAEREACIERFRRRGITDVVATAHVRGDVVKFYGVEGGFFRYYYPADDGRSKFGDERRNGSAHHYPFDIEALQTATTTLSRLLPIEVFGGDAIVEETGRFSIIDFNDWPSFSRCRQEAAEAIENLVRERIAKKKTIHLR